MVWCHYLCHLATLIHLKPDVYNVVTISAFAVFFVTCIHLWAAN